MLAEERFALILNLLAEKRTATVQELCEALNASESTIRRDLTELARQGRLNKGHGGATLPDGQFLADEPTMAAKEALAVGQKRSIAQAAADLIRAEDFIYIDAGTTTLAMVRALSGPALEAHYVTKAFIGANGVALNVGFTTPDPEEAAVKAAAARRARETWYLVDDSKFGRVYPAVIGEIYSGAILTNRCPDPKYRQLTLVKETEQ